MIQTVEAMIKKYVSAWNENNLEDYKKEFEKCFAADGVYIDPLGIITGVDELSGFAQTSFKIVPDRRFKVLQNPEYHHSFGKYSWEVEFAGGTNVGYDYFEFNDEFKITRLISFFTLPEDYPVDKLK